MYSTRSNWLSRRTSWEVGTFYRAWSCSEILSSGPSWLLYGFCIYYHRPARATHGLLLMAKLPFHSSTLDILASIVIICADAVTSDLLQTAQTHRTRERVYTRSRNSCWASSWSVSCQATSHWPTYCASLGFYDDRQCKCWQPDSIYVTFLFLW